MTKTIEQTETEPGGATNTRRWLRMTRVGRLLILRGTDYEIDVPGLSSQGAEFDLAPGEYEVFCAVPGHEKMQIDLVVEG